MGSTMPINQAPTSRRPWEKPILKPIGTVSEILKGGGGKLSTSPGDPGEPRKPPPTG
jgi:hypothetical protein